MVTYPSEEDTLFFPEDSLDSPLPLPELNFLDESFPSVCRSILWTSRCFFNLGGIVVNAMC